jgi:small nuclear ribonucleoprotein (snRNP)-like protein
LSIASKVTTPIVGGLTAYDLFTNTLLVDQKASTGNSVFYEKSSIKGKCISLVLPFESEIFFLAFAL